MILLDTHVLVWLQSEPRKISKSAKGAFERAQRRNEVAISAFTLYELAAYLQRGKLRRRESTESTIRLFIEGFIIKPITPEIAALAIEFPHDFPGDPGDRIIAATSRVEGIPLVTADQRLRASKLIKTIW
jgi:PIN domain nuclease of toxin-antitoxin system